MLRAKEERRFKGQGVYYEAHHIIPKCLGGTGGVYQYRHHPNVVLLTGREHLLAHRLLCNIHPTNIKLKLALRTMLLMSNNLQDRRKLGITQREFEELRRASAEHNSKVKSGIKQTDETIRKKLLKNRKPVICIDFNQTFSSVKEAGAYYGIAKTHISDNLKGHRRAVGVLKYNGGLTFKYL